ncbi:U-box domain-containing protein 35-like [Impatiens glandulifera]|uniref:U-box domain-containing protein 35-like n=1 Tax=Impatiens glandulifera TaxID=253017 RepID=UPI001FB0AD65|nr:U-box domain-containing protein 35-like [Impatiens glandulifera]
MEKRSDGELSHDDHDKYVQGEMGSSDMCEILEELVKVDDERVMICEIEELREEELRDSHIEFDGAGLQGVGDTVCVVINGDDDHGSSSSTISMDALLWTLTNGNGHGTGSSLFLVHVYPPLRFIPTALGKLPINQANEQQRNIHLAKQRTKRLQCLQPFLDLCSTSQVTADVIPIEGDKEANAILELISAFQIRTLVLGIPPRPRPRSSSSNIIITTTTKKEGRQGISGVAGRILEDAPEFCEVKIICQGKQLLVTRHDTAPSPSSSSSASSPTASSNNINNRSPLHPQQQQQPPPQTHALGAYCKCFKPRTIS